jgi:hypothetical protein
MTFTVFEGGKKAATVGQLAAMEFGAIGRIARMPKAKRLKNLDDIAMNVREFSLVASEIIIHEKQSSWSSSTKTTTVSGRGLWNWPMRPQTRKSS